MSTLKHTPGPWFLSPKAKYIRAEGIYGWNIAAIEDQQPFTQANAYLIAAAPELLEACIRAKDYLHTKYPKEADIFNELDKAITKATQ